MLNRQAKNLRGGRRGIILNSYRRFSCDTLCRYVVICALWNIGLSSLHKEALADDLLQVYRDALTFDAAYTAAKANFDAGVEKLPQGRASLLPKLSVSGQTAWNELDNQSLNFEKEYNSNGYTLQLIQPLFNISVWEDFKEGQILAAQAEAQLVADTQDLMVRAAKGYFDVLAAQDVLDAQESLKAASEEQLDLVKHKFGVGTAPITDVDEAQSRYDLATAQVIEAQNDLAVKKHALSQITGKNALELSNLRSGFTLTGPQPKDMDQWVESAEGGNPVVLAKRLSYEYASREETRARSQHLPTLHLVASRQKSDDVNTQVGIPNKTLLNSFMLQLNMPLFEGGQMFSKDRETAALRERSLAEWNDAKRTAGQAARQNYLGVISGLAKSKALESAVTSSTDSLNGNRKGYKVGMRANIDVLNAQSQLADAHQRLTTARFDTILAQLKLKAAAGQLGERDLEEINTLLERQ